MAEGFGVVAVRMDRLAGQLDSRAVQQMSEAGALAMKDEATRRLVLTVGGDRSLSGYGRGARRGRVKGTVGFDYEDRGTSLIKYRPPGFWTLLEAGSYKAGGTWKEPKRKGSARRKKGSIGTYRRSPVRARRTLTKATDDAGPKIRDAVADAANEAISQLLGGT